MLVELTDVRIGKTFVAILELSEGSFVLGVVLEV